MAKLQLLIDQTIHEPDSIMTHYKRFVEEVKQDADGYKYQTILLTDYERANGNVDAHYRESISNIATCMENRFEEIATSPFFKHLVCLLDTAMWPRDETIGVFGDKAIAELIPILTDLLVNNGNKIDSILPEWTVLKTYVLPLIANNPKQKYLEIWKTIFTNEVVLRECRNALDIFSRMNRVKSDWRNNLSRERLDTLLRIGEDGPSLDEFNPDPFIDSWFNEKVRRLTAGPHKYPQKRAKFTNQPEQIDLAITTLSDLEDSDSDVEE